MQHALSLARRVTPRSTNFCVGAVLVDEEKSEVMYTGYTLELPDNTHAEECCLTKLRRDLDDGTYKPSPQQRLVLYTTMEPCNKRASGNMPCTDRILQTLHWGGDCAIKRVYIGVQEPEKFVGANEGKKRLAEAGIPYCHITGMEEEILRVASAGHEK